MKRIHDRVPEHAFPAALPEAGDEATDVASEFDLAVLEVEVERRRMERIPVRRPLLVVPVKPNGKPDWEGRNEGVTVDVSPIGLRLLLERSPSAEARELVLVVPESQGTVRCAGLEIKHVESFSPQHVEVGAQIGGFADQLFRSENITPAFRPERGTFGLGLPEDVLEAWASVGLLERRVFDRVSLCPRCRSLPTFRRGCSNCGAAVGLTQDELLHHFACAYIGPILEFQHDDVLQCPKCRTRHLVIGTDYENLPGMFRCSGCHWSGDEPCSVGHCMRCQFRFPAQQAVEIELKGYHVERLDPLALAAAS